MALHRIFIAINLPEAIKKELLEYQSKWPELPARWTSKENLHLTLAFLGNTSDQELTEVYKLMQGIGERHAPFEFRITHLQYGPDTKRPRMVWALIEKSPELLTLQKSVETSLTESSQVHYRAETSPYSSHLTLARLKTFELQRMETEEIPDINEEISLRFDVQSIEVMESKLHRGGAEYTVCQSAPLEGQM